MTIEYAQTWTSGNASLRELQVDVAGMAITVRAGPFRSDGIAYALDEDVEHTVVNHATEITWASAYLVRNKSTGEVSVFVDEMEVGDDPYVFNDSPYQPLGAIFIAQMPPDTTDLADAQITVHRVSKDPEPEPEPVPEPEPEG